MSGSARPAVQPAQEPAHTAAPRTAASAAAAHASVSSARCASQHEKVTSPSLAWEKLLDATATSLPTALSLRTKVRLLLATERGIRLAETGRA